MKFVFASYVKTNEFAEPMAWLKRIGLYSGILTSLSKNHRVISIEQIAYEGDCTQDGVQYKFMRFSKGRQYFPMKLHRTIQQLQPDVVVVHGLHFALQVIQLRLLLGEKVKIIVQNHAEQPFAGVKKYLQRWASNFIDAYLFASRDMGLDWVKKGNIKSAEKIHEVMEVSSVFYPIDKQFARDRLKLTNQPFFLWVGRLNENKDPLNVIKAFLKFAAINPTARLYMIYHTEELLPDINILLIDEPNSSAITMVGKVPNDELLFWYNAADFILSGSYYEGSGTAICEAMSCGCIPIVTDIFSFRMITDNGNCGMLYEPGNEVALLSALNQALQMDVEQKRQLCLDYFESTLSFDAIADRIAAIAARL